MQHPCVRGWVAHRRTLAAPRRLRWRCRRLATACPLRLVGDIGHAKAVFHKVFGQENEPGASHKQPRSARHQREAPKSRLGGAFVFPLAVLAALRGGRARVHEKKEVND